MTIGIGVIGLGVMGAEHVRLLQGETVGAHLVAVCDADAGRAAAVADKTRAFTDPMALIHDAGVQAVVIASPDATHAALAKACLALGKPVLCEKPLATTAAEALQIVSAETALGRRLVQAGYMRRFDPAYIAMKAAADDIGAPALLHNIHRNVAAPDWFSGPMAVTNSFVHEIDISRWLLGAEMVSARVQAAPGGDPLLITMVTDCGVIVSTEVFMNARYGYHVHAELVGSVGTVELAPPSLTRTNHAWHHGHSYPENWVPRFRDAYRAQMNGWVASLAGGEPVGASAWDGYVATAVAEQIAAGMGGEKTIPLRLPPRPDLYH